MNEFKNACSMLVGDFNPNHDPSDGRFTSGSGSSGSNNPGSYTDSADVDVRSNPDYIGDRNVEAQINELLRYHLGYGEEYASVDDFTIVQTPTESGIADVEAEYSVSANMFVGYDLETGEALYESETDYRTAVFQVKVLN